MTSVLQTGFNAVDSQDTICKLDGLNKTSNMMNMHDIINSVSVSVSSV